MGKRSQLCLSEEFVYGRTEWSSSALSSFFAIDTVFLSALVQSDAEKCRITLASHWIILQKLLSQESTVKPDIFKLLHLRIFATH